MTPIHQNSAPICSKKTSRLNISLKINVIRQLHPIPYINHITHNQSFATMSHFSPQLLVHSSYLKHRLPSQPLVLCSYPPYFKFQKSASLNPQRPTGHSFVVLTSYLRRCFAPGSGYETNPRRTHCEPSLPPPWLE